MKIKQLFLTSFTAIALLSACSSDNDTIISDDENTLRVSADNIKYTINTANFDLVGDVKSVEKSYYPRAEYDWIKKDSINKRWISYKEVKDFDQQGAIVSDKKISSRGSDISSYPYNLIEKSWNYDSYYRITEYKEINTAQDDSISSFISGNMWQYSFDDNTKKATVNSYLGESAEIYSLLKTAQYPLGDNQRIVYPESITNSNVEATTRSAIDQSIYNYYNYYMSFEKSKKQLYQYKDSQGNIVLSYLRYDIRDQNDYIITGQPIIKSYYEQTITYYDGSTSDNSTITESITDQEFEFVKYSY